MKSWPGHLEHQNCHALDIIWLKINEIWALPAGAQNGHSSMIIWLKINEFWAWPAATPKLSFFNDNLFENLWNLGLANWSPKLVILVFCLCGCLFAWLFVRLYVRSLVCCLAKLLVRSLAFVFAWLFACVCLLVWLIACLLDCLPHLILKLSLDTQCRRSDNSLSQLWAEARQSTRGEWVKALYTSQSKRSTGKYLPTTPPTHMAIKATANIPNKQD